MINFVIDKDILLGDHSYSRLDAGKIQAKKDLEKINAELTRIFSK